MSMLTMARGECANFTQEGGCMGVHHEGLINHRLPVRPLDRCLLRNKDGDRCLYFEQVVLPLADKPSPITDNYQQQRYREARKEYQASRMMALKKDKVMRFCECGAPLSFGKIFCPECLRKHRRERPEKKNSTGMSPIQQSSEYKSPNIPLQGPETPATGRAR